VCSCPGFASSEEAHPIERLLDAFYENDQDAANAVLKSPLFKFMENDVSFSEQGSDSEVEMVTNKV